MILSFQKGQLLYVKSCYEPSQNDLTSVKQLRG